MPKSTFYQFLISLSLCFIFCGQLSANNNENGFLPPIIFSLLDDGSTIVPPLQPSNSLSDIASGYLHTCKIINNGQVICWGATPSQIALGPNAGIPAPVLIPGIETAISLSADSFYNCALLADTTVKCWGRDYSGELGNGADTSSATATWSATPIAVLNHSNLPGVLKGVTSISSGYSHSCAILSGGKVTCWGSDTEGGASVPSDPGKARLLTKISNAIKVVSGFYFNCALIVTGEIKCWGISGKHLGNGTTTNIRVPIDSPVLVNNISTAVDISAGPTYVCALLANSTVKCWGINDNGPFGNGTEVDSPVPVSSNFVSSDLNKVFADGDNTCLVTSSGSAYCMGSNSRGQIGNGTGGDLPDNSLVPVRASYVDPVLNMSFGIGFACASLTSGRVKCSGNNGSRQLGIYDRNVEQSLTPIFVPFIN